MFTTTKKNIAIPCYISREMIKEGKENIKDPYRCIGAIALNVALGDYYSKKAIRPEIKNVTWSTTCGFFYEKIPALHWFLKLLRFTKWEAIEVFSRETSDLASKEIDIMALNEPRMVYFHIAGKLHKYDFYYMRR